MSQVPRPISDEEEALIIRLWKERKTGSQIGAAVGRSRNAIMGKLNRLRSKGVIELLPEGEARFKPKSPVAAPVSQPKKTPSLAVVPSLSQKAEKVNNPPLERITSLFVPPEPAPEPMDPIKFTDLKPMSCRYVVSGKRPENFLFCGMDKKRGAYCAEHAALSYVSVERKRPGGTFKLEKTAGFLNR